MTPRRVLLLTASSPAAAPALAAERPRRQARRRPAGARRLPARQLPGHRSDCRRRRLAAERTLVGGSGAHGSAGGCRRFARRAEVPDSALVALAALPPSVRRRQPRPAGPRRRSSSTRADDWRPWVAESAGLDGTGVGVAIIDSGVTASHDDLGTKRVVHFARLRQLPAASLRRLRPRHARRGHHRRQRQRLRRRAPRHRARCAPHRAQGARRAGDGIHQQRHRRDRLRDRQPRRPSTSASSTCRSRPACTSRTTRIRSRSRQSAPSTPASSSSRPPATSAARRRAEDAVRRHHVRPATRRGC